MPVEIGCDVPPVVLYAGEPYLWRRIQVHQVDSAEFRNEDVGRMAVPVTTG
jgi:hypothetical protein